MKKNHKKEKQTRRSASPPERQEEFFDDYWPEEDPYNDGGAHLTEAERERYYAERDAYYAERDAYYARRDAYYAGREDEAGEYADGEYPDEEYAEEEYEDERPVKEKSAAGKKRRRKKRHPLRRLAVLLLFAALVAMLLGHPPVRNETGESRERGHSTVLLCGTDAEGYRTDTIMLLSLNRVKADVRLLSIPRDTYVEGYYSVPKINSAYAVGGGGESGMEELMRQVARVTGFMPDAYILIDLDCFVQAVDLLGGADYNVPVEMQYEDYTQNLVIDLHPGEQHLNGEQVMGLVRFRSGYATADIGRTEVQRDFMKTALRQWLRLSKISALPGLWRLYKENTLTDLSAGNLLWVLRVLVKSDLSRLGTDVLPGYSAMIGGASCYVVDASAAAPILAPYDPYQ